MARVIHFDISAENPEDLENSTRLSLDGNSRNGKDPWSIG